MARSQAFGIIEMRERAMPRAATPSAMPGDSAITCAEAWYASHSTGARDPDRDAGCVRAPTAIGISGHRSRTSNTIGARRTTRATMPGRAIVSGVELASTTSAGTRAASSVARSANRTKAPMRAR